MGKTSKISTALALVLVIAHRWPLDSLTLPRYHGTMPSQSAAQPPTTKPPQRFRPAGMELQVNRHRRAIVPPTRRNGARDGARWLFPEREATYREAIAALLAVRWDSARHWLRGTRPLPRWARDRLADAMRVRLERGAAILAELEAMAVYEPKPRKPPQKKTPAG